MSISTRTRRFVSDSSILSHLQTLIFISQRSNHTLAGNGQKSHLHHEAGFDPAALASSVDMRAWKAVNSRCFRIYNHMIPRSSWTVLKILKHNGYDAYLVGGCVRDLILKRIPKDFDIITTADLKQIKKQFHRCQVVGRRFPICRVFIQGSVIEVSSFGTVAKHDEGKQTANFSQMPIGCNEKNFFLWKNSLCRDFTINSLFYDPFVDTIYDYANGIDDLISCKVRTVIPAKISFEEDCARMLRGLRIAARLGLSFSKETEIAIQDHLSSIKNLNKTRLMLEMNYMFSYGAAESSLCLLRRFKLLDIILPFHAAYLVQESPGQSAQSSLMLMKLFSCMDKLLACDRPSGCFLWVALLSFHLALVNNPQKALVIWAFSAVLYHGNWRKAVKFARESAQLHVQFVPEISDVCGTMTDEELTEDVISLASKVRSSIGALTDADKLESVIQNYPFASPCLASQVRSSIGALTDTDKLESVVQDDPSASPDLGGASNLVFISKAVGQNVGELFRVFEQNLEKYANERKSFEIDYGLLAMGNIKETRFLLGKVIMDAMSSGVFPKQQEVVVQEQQGVATGNHHVPFSSSEKQHRDVKRKTISPKIKNLEQQHDESEKEINGSKRVSILGKRKVVAEKRNGEFSELANLKTRIEPENKGNPAELANLGEVVQERQEVANEKINGSERVLELRKRASKLWKSKVVTKKIKDKVEELPNHLKRQNEGECQGSESSPEQKKVVERKSNCDQSISNLKEQEVAGKEKSHKPLSSLFL
ncbi:uncharacterized protein LOC113298485 isoform X1 [Papaver somniferum]|uniref:uncharacterized protein LOC113298485 isoform X1 n=2 Tax=Papaver somniferum TaxID=3469 RepID=UPI000E6F9269|nr:uncharacterized protein LOC113298485 isoform X1 [Papaver somniferum]